MSTDGSCPSNGKYECRASVNGSYTKQVGCPLYIVHQWLHAIDISLCRYGT